MRRAILAGDLRARARLAQLKAPCSLPPGRTSLDIDLAGGDIIFDFDNRRIDPAELRERVGSVAPAPYRAATLLRPGDPRT